MRLFLKYEGLGRLKKMVKLTRLLPTLIDDELNECQNIFLSDEFDWGSSKHFLKFLQWRRSIGKVQIFIDTSILFRAESHVLLQRSNV